MQFAHISLTPVYDCSSIAHVSVANELFLYIMWYVVKSIYLNLCKI